MVREFLFWDLKLCLWLFFFPLAVENSESASHKSFIYLNSQMSLFTSGHMSSYKSKRIDVFLSLLKSRKRVYLDFRGERASALTFLGIV